MVFENELNSMFDNDKVTIADFSVHLALAFCLLSV